MTDSLTALQNMVRQEQHEAHIERFRGAIAILSKGLEAAHAVQTVNAIWDETYITKAETDRNTRTAKQVSPRATDLTPRGIKVGDRVEDTGMDGNSEDHRGTVLTIMEDYATVNWDKWDDETPIHIDNLERLIDVATDEHGDAVWSTLDAVRDEPVA